jgi:uncharacterized protein (TIGR00266 family)
MKRRIMGTTMQSVDILLSQGEALITEVGGMAWYRGEIKMETNMPGGILGGLGRMVAGESVFLTTYTCIGESAEITFTPESPGSIQEITLMEGESIIAQRDAFMVGQASVTLAPHFKQNLGIGLFGGEGFILQRVTGPGLAFFEIDGEVREYELGAGEVMHINPGHIALMDMTITHKIERVKGVANVLLGGEGFFLATLTGPGRIWLQSMPINNLIDKVISKLPKPSS